MCVCIYTCMYACLCMYVCMYAYMGMYVCMYACVCVHVCIVCICVHVCVYVASITGESPLVGSCAYVEQNSRNATHNEQLT